MSDATCPTSAEQEVSAAEVAPASTPSSPIRRQCDEPPLPPFGTACIDALRLGVTIIFNSLLSFGINRTVGMSLVGLNHTPRDIAVAGIGITLYNVAGVSIPIGFSCAVDTLCSQAHGRNPTSAEAGNWLKIGLFLTILMAIPAVCFFLFFAEPLLMLMFDPEMSKDVTKFLLYCIPFVFLQSMNICLGRGLQATKRADIPTLGAICGTTVFCIIAPFMIQASVYYYPVALAIANVVPMMAIFFYCHLCDGEESNLIARVESWNPLSASFRAPITLDACKHFSALGFQSAIAISSEWIAVECVVLFGSQLDTTADIAALQIAWIVIAILFCIPLSMSVTSSAFVGNALGRNEPKAAEFFAETCQVVNIGITLATSVVIILLSSYWNTFFSRDDTVLSTLGASTMAIMVFHNGQSNHISIQGIFRGCAWQDFCAKVVGVSLYGIGLPCTYFFGVRNYFYTWFGWELNGVSRLLLGFSIGYFCEVAALVYGMTLLPWSKMATEASAERKAIQRENRRASLVHET